MELLKEFNEKIENSNNSIILISVIKNENLLLEYFIKYYFNIGITHFIFIDNNSSDESVKFLLDNSNNMMVFKTTESFKDNKVKWIDNILDKYCKNKWVVIADADELIHIDNLTKIKDQMEKEEVNACKFYLLDMYPKDLEKKYIKGDPFLSHSNYYDNNLNGVRQRVFKIKIWLQKISFFKYNFYCCNKIICGHHCFKNFADHNCIRLYEKTHIFIHKMVRAVSHHVDAPRSIFETHCFSFSVVL